MKTTKLNIPVISVGNLTMGGSGKTPVVMYIAKLLLKNGYKPAAVSRGYGGSARNSVNIVSDGKTIFMNSSEAGDEPRLIAESVPGIFVLTGKKRLLPCEHVENVYGGTAIILDDGFQHESVQRDINMVLFNAATLYSNFHVFPGGLLREPFSALHRADCFCITGCTDDNRENVKRFSSFLEENYKRPLFKLQYRPICFVDRQGRETPFTDITEPVFAFCGIASPERFYKTLENLSLDIRSFHPFNDHQKYTTMHIKNIVDRAHASGAKYLITTEKDLVKIHAANLGLPLLAVSMEVKSDSSFDNFVSSKLVDGRD